MAFTTINKFTDYFNTKLYTGTGSGNKAVTGVGFQPDWIWTKNRVDAYGHNIYDAVRGVGKYLTTNGNNAESAAATSLVSFDSDGFTVGTGDNVQYSSNNGVSWNWKAGTTGSGTTTGSGYGKAYSYSVNTTAGFSIITYKGNGSAGHTIPHHLGATPNFIIVKNRDSTQSWLVGITALGWTKNLHLNETGAVETSSAIWNDTAPTSTVFTVGTNTKCNTNDDDYIAYCFAEKNGYSKFGSYTGNGSTTGPFIYTGFKPSWVMIKNTSASNDWFMIDNSRDTLSPNNPVGRKSLEANDSAAEVTRTSKDMDFLSNGIKLRTADGTQNNSGENYIYMAFGQSIVGSNNIPATAR
tara:strand:- start:78 stop:1136 length:1059 start_codon:yes stop_codon:yes gene_type:complete